MFWLRELHCGSFQSDWLVYFSSVTCHPQKILKIKESDNLGREKNVMKMNFQSIFQATRLMDKQQPFQKVSWAKPVVFHASRTAETKMAAGEEPALLNQFLSSAQGNEMTSKSSPGNKHFHH